MKTSWIGILLFLVITAYAQERLELFKDKHILILGGTGYLGCAIAQEVLKYSPKKITIFSRDEVKHFHIAKMFEKNPIVEMVIGDIRDYESLLAATRNVDIVFHVAALKRMDALECNVQEAVKTNIQGSLNVFNVCVVNGVDKVLFVSTDKACLPINAYGACKFVSEKIFTNYDQTKIKTKFVVTRFGNILESTGSVIPIFTQKIINGEEIPLTDERMTRFIISKDQAAQLMCDALLYSHGGEIVTKRLPALRVVDLINVLKEYYSADNQIKLIGLRPGEKLHEVLINEFESKRAYEYKGYFFIRPSINSHSIDKVAPDYIVYGRYLGAAQEGDYSSDKAVIIKQELRQLFDLLGIFKTVGTRINEKIAI